jgi:ribosomal protein S18 acetylase RimI-like enzyme
MRSLLHIYGNMLRVRTERLTAAGLKELREPLLDLYRRCFAEPPWSETDFRVFEDVADEHFTKSGLTAVAAVEGDDLVGVIYGWPCPDSLPDDDYHKSVPRSALPHMVAPAHTVSELMVHPGHQRKGIGRRLLSEYMRDVPSAWLVTHPEAPARALYDSAGWQAGEEFVNHRGIPRVFYFYQSR